MKTIRHDEIIVEEAVYGVYRELTNGPISMSPFRMMKDVFLWSAVLGCEIGQRQPLEGRREGVFRWSAFTAQVDVPLLKAIAIADSKDLEIITNQHAILVIAEEYANSGIHELRARLVNSEKPPLWNLVEAILNGSRFGEVTQS